MNSRAVNRKGILVARGIIIALTVWNGVSIALPTQCSVTIEEQSDGQIDSAWILTGISFKSLFSTYHARVEPRLARVLCTIEYPLKFTQ
jgi:hypothetical protein